MEFLWVYLYNLKTPITWGAGVGALVCIVLFLQGLSAQNRSPGGKFDARTGWGLISLMLLGCLWSAFYAIPAPDYKVRYVEKKVPVKYVRTITKYTGVKTVVKEPTFDERFKWCYNNTQNGMDKCLQYANIAKSPRIVEKKVGVPVFKGEKIIVQKPIYATEFRYCMENFSNGTFSNCKEYATDAVNSNPRVVTKTVNVIRQVPVFKGEKIVVQKDPFLSIYKYCNETFRINVGNAQGAQIRNQRLAICKDVALAGGAK